MQGKKVKKKTNVERAYNALYVAASDISLDAATILMPEIGCICGIHAVEEFEKDVRHGRWTG